MMTTPEIVDRLNQLYWTDIEGYQTFLKKVKDAGYKVLRNSKGKHIVNGGFSDVFTQLFNGQNPFH